MKTERWKMSNLLKGLATTALTTFVALPALAQPLGLGRTALPEEISAWDVAVQPNGTGLRPGAGNVMDGEDLWVEHCAACHGDFGEGAGAFPVIAGGIGTLTDARPVKTVGSYWPYLSTVWDYVNRSMPFGNAQSLEVDEVYAITAYILYSNNLVDDDFELTHENFQDIRLPNEDGFYADDRDAVEVPLFSVAACFNDCAGAPVVRMRATDLQSTPEGVVTVFAPDRGGETQAMGETHDHGAAPAEAVAEAETPAEEVVQMASVDPALVAAGEAAWRQCRSCHTVGEGARNGTGPALNGVYGAAAAQVAGFRYSPALTGAASDGLVWTAENLDAFLENPGAFVRGNRMSFRGIRSADERAAMIAYLSTFAN
jgi:cytochrome c2